MLRLCKNLSSNITKKTQYSLSLLQDTYVDNSTENAGTNYNSNAFLLLSYKATDYKGVLLEFDMTNIIGKTINSATLYLYRKNAFSGDMQSAVKYVNAEWDESTAVFDNVWNKLDNTDYGYHSHTAGAGNSSESWDLKSLIEDIAYGTITDYNGLYIYTGGTGEPLETFYDESGGIYKPKLIVNIA